MMLLSYHGMVPVQYLCDIGAVMVIISPNFKISYSGTDILFSNIILRIDNTGA